ncbi:hypothetical protein L218DRAFT_1076989 [Marasmius fiardii PR-910]|nr:hypothetical protein L218DRAFT_1076989 [Marasmius fiardii PR-910]
MTFTVCMMVLRRRTKTPERTFHITLMISLFVLATLGLGINTALVVIQAASDLYQWAREEARAAPESLTTNGLLLALRVLSLIMTMLSNILADVVLTFRCYVIWNFRKSLIIVPTIACLLSNGKLSSSVAIGIVSMAIMVSAASSPNSALASQAPYLEGTYFIMNALINVALTSIVAGRIWLTGAQSKRYFTEESLKKRCFSIASIILQSGLIYPVILIISVPFTLLPSLSGWDLHPLLIQVAGICPTLMIVRVGLGAGVMAEKGSSAGRVTFNVEAVNESWHSA